jgi:hypothetical protein
MDWRKLYYSVIYHVFSYFQRLATRGRLEYALSSIHDNASAACKLSKRTISRAVKFHLNGPSDSAVAAVVASVHGNPEKRTV